jgi:hypothetical protein
LAAAILPLALHVHAAAQEQGSSASDATIRPPAVAVPKNPSDILSLAATLNGVDGANARPWHIKLSYDEFDEDGDNVRSGLLEEFHISPTKYRRIYTTDNFNQTEVATGSALYRSGDQAWPPSAQSSVRDAALRPLYVSTRSSRETRLDKIDRQIGSAKLSCVVFRQTAGIISPSTPRIIVIGAMPAFCFDAGTVMLRYKQDMGGEITYNNFILFQEHYVARDIAITLAGRAFLKIHVEELGEIAEVRDTFFQPPPGSVDLIGTRVAVPWGAVLDECVISEGTLNHPRSANGRVNVKVIIDKEGKIRADAMDGPPALHKAVLDALHGYKLRPFLILGQPVEVESRTAFEFR